MTAIVARLFLAASEEGKLTPLDVHEALKELLHGNGVDLHSSRLEVSRAEGGNTITTGRLPKEAA